jgi:hypothetical protein
VNRNFSTELMFKPVIEMMSGGNTSMDCFFIFKTHNHPLLK